MAFPKDILSASGHMSVILKALESAKWHIAQLPESGHLKRNGQTLIFDGPTGYARLRIFVFSVTDSSRNRPEERRIEITSTYQNNLKKARGFKDVVCGYDYKKKAFVGVDPRRLSTGGPTGNASSFFDGTGLDWKKKDQILIRQRASQLWKIEFHAFFKQERLVEYLFNFDQIHSGSYDGQGEYSGPLPSRSKSKFFDARRIKYYGENAILLGANSSRRKFEIPQGEVEDFEKISEGRKPRKKRVITPEKLAELHKTMDENGRLGEEFVLNHERQLLRRRGKEALAKRVKWISQESVGEGFDILSFEPNGAKKFIEVKSTSGTSTTFPMSDSEWKTGVRKKTQYYIYRVTKVRTSPSISKILRDPASLERSGVITKISDGWLVSY